MSFEAVQQEITTWDAAALRRLIAYAVVLQDRKSGIFPEQFAASLMTTTKAAGFRSRNLIAG
jgi:hypothetical protein